MKDDWWHVILAMPVVIAVELGIAIALGGIPSIAYLVQGLFALLFPIALYQDVKYVGALKNGWRPGRGRYLLAGLLVLVTMGLLSVIVSPYYLRKRSKYV